MQYALTSTTSGADASRWSARRRKKERKRARERDFVREERRTCRNLKGIVDHQGHRGKKIAGLFRREEKKVDRLRAHVERSKTRFYQIPPVRCDVARFAGMSTILFNFLSKELDFVRSASRNTRPKPERLFLFLKHTSGREISELASLDFQHCERGTLFFVVGDTTQATQIYKFFKK